MVGVVGGHKAREALRRGHHAAQLGRRLDAFPQPAEVEIQARLPPGEADAGGDGAESPTPEERGTAEPLATPQGDFGLAEGRADQAPRRHQQDQQVQQEVHRLRRGEQDRRAQKAGESATTGRGIPRRPGIRRYRGVRRHLAIRRGLAIQSGLSIRRGPVMRRRTVIRRRRGGGGGASS